MKEASCNTSLFHRGLFVVADLEQLYKAIQHRLEKYVVLDF